MASSFIGSKVRLVTKDDKAYEGIVHFINLEESIICVKKEICLGEIDDESQVPGSSQHFTFTGNEIKDLEVLSPPPDQRTGFNGCFVSVMTTEDVRVEGFLCDLDLDKSMFIMKNAHCYGTEGRRKKRKQRFRGCNDLEVPIEFKFRELKDLEVILLPEPHIIDEQSTGCPPVTRKHNSHVPEWIFQRDGR